MKEYIVKYRNERGNVSRLGPFNNIISAGQAARLNDGRVYLVEKGRDKLIPQSEVDNYIKPSPRVAAALYQSGYREYVVKRQNAKGDFINEGPFGNIESAHNYASEVDGEVYEVMPSDKAVKKKSPAGLIIIILIVVVSGFLGEIVGGFGSHSAGVWFLVLLLGYWLYTKVKPKQES